MKVIYTSKKVATEVGACYRNPDYYYGPEACATAVTIDGDYQSIHADYKALGVSVTRHKGELELSEVEPVSTLKKAK